MSATIAPMRRLEAPAVARLPVSPGLAPAPVLPVVLVLLFVSLLVLAGCRPNGNVPTVPAGTVPPATGAAIPTPSPVPATIAPADQVDTDWGPIWARLPDAFPVPPGAEPAEADTTVSGAWTVPVTAQSGPREVAQFFADRFSGSGLGGGLDGPLEDGSYTVWASNGYGCDILATVARRGDEETFATVLYGAGCPFRWLAAG
jgi:hypothetical protein